MPPRLRHFAVSTAAVTFAASATLGVGAFVLSPRAAFAAGPKAKSGDILRVFNDAHVLVVTNEDAALVDALLDGTHPKTRRVVSVDDWVQHEPSDNKGEVRVFLINREKLPVSGVAAINTARRLPEGSCGDTDEIWAFGRKVGKKFDGRESIDIVLSAPDGAWLKQNVREFRNWVNLPYDPNKRPVSSMGVIALGQSGDVREAAAHLTLDNPVSAGALPRFHTVAFDDWTSAALRTSHSDELILIDRSSLGAGELAASAPILAGKTIGANETLVWRQRKNTDKAGKTRWRIVVSAPNGAMLSEAIKRYPDPRRVPTTPLVVSTARDLRGVRRVAVAGVKNNALGADIIKRIASRTATELRSMDAFEVPDRAGLSEILSEIALQQAGITKANDRARVQQLAAADALLIVEITDAGGRTDYSAQCERVTPKMGKAPRKPLEPSRFRGVLSLPGKEDDPTVRSLGEALLGRALGTKSDDDYQRDLYRYNSETLPRWQQMVTQYQNERDTRTVEWRQAVRSQSKATVSGSLRLVDLTDGLVLWEAPFTVSDTSEQAEGVSTVTSRGDDSGPPTDTCPQPISKAPDALTARCAENAVTQAVRGLRLSALLPQANGSLIADATAAASSVHTAPKGKLLDIDGESYLIGLGQTDGVKVGDVLTIALDDKTTARLIVTRARPRTCDAAWDKTVPAALTARVSVGQFATPASVSTPAVVVSTVSSTPGEKANP